MDINYTDMLSRKLDNCIEKHYEKNKSALLLKGQDMSARLQPAQLSEDLHIEHTGKMKIIIPFVGSQH